MKGDASSRNLRGSLMLILLFFQAALKILLVSAGNETELEPLLMPQITLNPMDFGLNLNYRDWDFGGSAYVDLSGFLVLSPKKGEDESWIWTRRISNAKNWVVFLNYRIKMTREATFLGEGFAFWSITSLPMVRGSAMGHSSTFTGMGVFIDLFRNDRNKKKDFPRIIGISAPNPRKYDRLTDGLDIADGSCYYNIKFDESNKALAFSYDRHKNFTVYFAVGPESSTKWVKCFTIQNPPDLSKTYLGFTSGGINEGAPPQYEIHKIVGYSDMKLHDFPTFKQLFSSDTNS